MRKGGRRPKAEGAAADGELVALCREQLPYATAAFEELVRRYEPLVLRTCWQYLGDRGEAEEASQDVFMRVFRGLPEFGGRSTFRTWLFRIAYNVCATRRARREGRARREASYVEEVLAGGEATAAADPPDDPPPDRATLRALEQLPEMDRQVIVLRFVSELSLREIAETFDLTLSAAKMRLYRAVERFQTAYKKDPPGV